MFRPHASSNRATTRGRRPPLVGRTRSNTVERIGSATRNIITGRLSRKSVAAAGRPNVACVPRIDAKVRPPPRADHSPSIRRPFPAPNDANRRIRRDHTARPLAERASAFRYPVNPISKISRCGTSPCLLKIRGAGHKFSVSRCRKSFRNTKRQK